MSHIAEVIFSTTLANSSSLESIEINAMSDGPTSGGNIVPLGTHMEAPLISDSASDSSESESSPGGESLDARRNLNTLFGVFCPVSLSMFSACLFLRVGYLIGESGVLLCLAELVLAYLLLTLTTLSISAISTNGAIAGGDMISRALGPEFGGALGMLFFWANIFACALYLAGAVEQVINTFGPGGLDVLPVPDETAQWWTYLYSSVVLLLILGICILGGGVFTRFSSVTLSIVTFSVLTIIISTFIKEDDCIPVPKDNHIASFPGNCTNYTGYSTKTFTDNLLPNWSVDYTQPAVGIPGFGVVFAVLFSSVTGIMNGANMSGELKRPSYSIPFGTLYGMAFTFVVYTILAILTSFTSSRDLLMNDYHYMQATNVISWFVIVGSFCATFSAASGNLIGASRYLEALADDEIFWGVLRFGRVRYNGNPWVAVLVSWLLVQVFSIINNLNQIAPLVTVCYLLMYSGCNLACLALEVASAPNFRPTFRYFSWHTCVLGFVGCMVMCFVVHALFSAVAIALFLGLLILLQFRNFEAQWGSISQAIIFHQVRKYLLLLDPRRDHVKFWRPQIVLMVANPRSAFKLMDFVNDLKKSGLYVVGHVVIGNWDNYKSDPIKRQQNIWRDVVRQMNVKAFVELTMASSVREGLLHLIRLAGLGGMKPNTVVLGFYDDAVPVQVPPTAKPSRSFIPRFMQTRGNNTAYSVMENGSTYQAAESSKLGDALSALPPLRSHEKLLGHTEYIKMLWDIVKMNKNLVICRHFASFNKYPILDDSVKEKLLIDVWPINPFKTSKSLNISGTSSMFLMQIACVLHMVRGWRRRSALRIFLLEGRKNSEVENSDTYDVIRSVKKQLQEFRIEASVEVISTRNTWASRGSLNGSEDNASTFLSVPKTVISEINALMRSNSSSAGVVFAQLPEMPHILEFDAMHADEVSKNYLDRLQMLTDNLPPTVLSLGLHSVTTKQL